MSKEVRQKGRVRYLNRNRITRSNATMGRISKSWRNVILGNGARRIRNPLSPLPLQSRRGNTRRPGMRTTRCGRRSIAGTGSDTRLWRRTSRLRRPSTTTNDDSRSRRRPNSARSRTSSLGIKLSLQIPGKRCVNTSTHVLHSIVLIVRIGRTLRSISYSLALRKAIGPAMAPATTTSIRHLQRTQQDNSRVRKIRYISFSKNIGNT
jgi:hypothetical protein